jgi:hypothetical protein
LILFVLATTTWSVSALGCLREISALRQITQRMLLAENISFDRLAPVLIYLDEAGEARSCDRGAEEAAVIRLYAAAAAQGRPDWLLYADKASQQIRAALQCSPHNAFQWYALFWIEMNRGVSVKQYLPYLELSYRLAPNESWLAYFRSGNVLPLFEELESTTQELVRQEYRLLLRDNPDVAVMILGEADEKSRSVILPLLSSIDQDKKADFAKKLDKQGVRVDVPGINYRELYKHGF